MPEPTATPGEDTLRTVFAYAELPLDTERLSRLSSEYAALLQLTASGGFRPLGETPPATAFHADWE